MFWEGVQWTVSTISMRGLRCYVLYVPIASVVDIRMVDSDQRSVRSQVFAFGCRRCGPALVRMELSQTKSRQVKQIRRICQCL